MTYGYGYPPPGKPPVDSTDMVISALALALTVLGAAAAAFLAVFMMAFTDHCPPETCHLDLGINLLFAGFLVGAVIALAGITATIIRLTRRLRAWPVAVGTLVLTGIACVLGMAGYISAVGG
jgi:hypothetical protein